MCVCGGCRSVGWLLLLVRLITKLRDIHRRWLVVTAIVVIVFIWKTPRDTTLYNTCRKIECVCLGAKSRAHYCSRMSVDTYCRQNRLRSFVPHFSNNQRGWLVKQHNTLSYVWNVWINDLWTNSARLVVRKRLAAQHDVVFVVRCVLVRRSFCHRFKRKLV